MYEFITHTGNIIKGKCPHNCSYCYMKKWKLKPSRLDEKEIKTDTEIGNFIFIGSSIDMFAMDIPDKWIRETLLYLSKYNNKYFFQSKNPLNMLHFCDSMPENSVLCTTIETNRFYPEHMGYAPHPQDRVHAGLDYVTIEPIMDFDIDELFEMIVRCKPFQVNIGADSGHNNLPEPSFEKVMILIEMLKGFTTVHKKRNLDRLLTIKNE